MLPTELRVRRKVLHRALQRLSGSPEVVRCDMDTLESGEAYVRFDHSVRIRNTAFRFSIREEFRDIDAEPQLYAFSYHLAEQEDIQAAHPLFRFECYPDVGDRDAPRDGGECKLDVMSPYERVPHFHPDHTEAEEIRKLHFPFHRTERKAVVFGLVEWLRVDLVRRFYHL